MRIIKLYNKQNKTKKKVKFILFFTVECGKHQEGDVHMEKKMKIQWQLSKIGNKYTQAGNQKQSSKQKKEFLK